MTSKQDADLPVLADSLAAYSARLTFESLPREVVHQAKRIVIDTLGCAIAGHASAPAKIACELAAITKSARPATVLCTGQKTSLDVAVFANGVMIRYLDFNDGYATKDAGHPSDNLAALLSAAEVGGTNGRELIVATVLAYEVFCRMCDAVDFAASGFDHVTMGAISSAVGAARLMGLNQQQTAEGINLTVAANNALFQTRIGNIAMWKACAHANASRNAVFALQLAALGMMGPAPIFEGRGGFFKAVSKQPFELALAENATQSFKIMESSTKRFPLGQYSQSIIEACLQARLLAGDYRNIAEVRIQTLQSALNRMADTPDKWRPANRETADHSIPYTAAVTLMYGTVEHRHFDEEHLHDPDLLDLVSRIKCEPSDEANRREAEGMLCDLELVLRSGERKAIRTEYHRGHWRNPMSDAEIEEKFHSLAGEVLPVGRVDSLLHELWMLEALPTVGKLIGMTRIGD